MIVLIDHVNNDICQLLLCPNHAGNKQYVFCCKEVVCQDKHI